MTAWLLALTIASGADAASTCLALRQSGTREMNALYGARPSCARVVATKAVGTTVTGLLAAKLSTRHPTAAKWTIGIAVSVNGVAVAWNVKTLR